MKSKRRLIVCGITAIAALSQVAAGPVAAEPASDCACAAGLVSNAGAKGSLIDVSGDVFVSGPNGYAEAKAGQALTLNSRVIVGPNGMANLRYGQCKVAAPSDSTATIAPNGQNVCVNVTKSYMGTAEQSAGFAGFGTQAMMPFYVGVGTLGFGFMGVGVAIAEELKASD